MQKDYQKFIQNRVTQLQETDKTGNSSRKLNRRCGFTSPNYLKLVIDGDRDLSPEGVQKVILGLTLTVTETNQFIELYLESIRKEILLGNPPYPQQTTLTAVA